MYKVSTELWGSETYFLMEDILMCCIMLSCTYINYLNSIKDLNDLGRRSILFKHKTPVIQDEEINSPRKYQKKTEFQHRDLLIGANKSCFSTPIK